MTQSSLHRCWPQSRFTNTRGQLQLPVFQRALLMGYSIIFGLVLPLICWGAYAVPGHPHRIPHFVFAIPPANHADVISPAVTIAAVDETPAQDHASGHQHHAATPADSTTGAVTQDQPVGQALLSLSLFSILTFVSLGLYEFLGINRRYIRRHFLPPFPQSIILPILLPPPRSSVGALNKLGCRNSQTVF